MVQNRDTIVLRGTLQGHSGWVTCLSTPPKSTDKLISGSRDNDLIVWDIVRGTESFGVARRRLTGHNHFISDCVISEDGQFAISASWDKTLILWDLEDGSAKKRFVGHTNDVLSVSFSPDNRQIVSGSRDRTIKLWNTIGECKNTIEKQGHTEWVSSVRFSPESDDKDYKPVIVSAGHDKLVKVWDAKNFLIKATHQGHSGYINTVTISPDGSLCASGGKDGNIMLWDLKESKHLYSLHAKEIVHALCFSPNRYWLLAATTSGIKIFHLQTKVIVDELTVEAKNGKEGSQPEPCSLAWSVDGQTLYSGWTDNLIRVWEIISLD